MIDEDLLAILVCPETHQKLTVADAGRVERVNAAIAEGAQKNAGGEVVREAIEGGLLREDGRVLYPVREGIPVLLVEEGLVVEA